MRQLAPQKDENREWIELPEDTSGNLDWREIGRLVTEHVISFTRFPGDELEFWKGVDDAVAINSGGGELGPAGSDRISRRIAYLLR